MTQCHRGVESRMLIPSMKQAVVSEQRALYHADPVELLNILGGSGHPASAGAAAEDAEHRQSDGQLCLPAWVRTHINSQMLKPNTHAKPVYSYFVRHWQQSGGAHLSDMRICLFTRPATRLMSSSTYRHTAAWVF